MERGIRVLVVDDDRRMVKTICDIVKVKGFEATPAYTGEEAVDFVRAGDADCVLMDIKMPGINGVEALKMIKEIAPDVPVILMSAYTTEEQAEEAKGHGAYTVLAKPIDIQMVLSFLSILRKDESILVVDDDPVFSKTLKDILQARGFRVETEVDPDRVLGHLEQDYKLAVILDLKLGKKNGLDVLKDIRTRYPSKPVVLVTGYGGEMADSIKEGRKIGAYACLYKPFETESLITTLEEISRVKMRAFFEHALKTSEA